ncbi:hypothetical protein CsatB_008268 [Cannabis sativa]|uniref:Uncharacterized protein n=1 Tax=Cannabis sativa TaxID=3483 RepID=A0A803QWF1_CANSA|nr:protein CLT2, chloroplastic [Cannabis sativa]
MKFRCLGLAPSYPIPIPAPPITPIPIRKNAPIAFHHSCPLAQFPLQPSSLHSDHNNTHILIRRKAASSNGRHFTARSSSPDSIPPSPSPPPSSSITQQVIVSSALTIAFAVANRVLYKLALVPMKEYPFFLAQLATFGYVIVYFVILYMRYNGGLVTDEMMAQPKSLFVAIGVLEALGVVLGMASAAMLPGPAIPILSQTFLVWQLILSVFILRRTYTISQIAGCLLVAIGVAVAVTSGSNANQMLYGVELVWPVLMIASSAFQAGASIIKEFVFIDSAARLKGKTLDIFVVNSFGSGFQALFVLLFLPFLSSMKGIPFAQLPSYFKSGVGCFLNIGASTSGCEGSPLLPLLYIATNLMFNISVLNLVKTSSAVVSSLAVMLSVPVSIYILSVPLPYLPVTSTLGPFFLFGSFILVLGLILYTLPQPSKQH